ncbi:ribonuclease E/G [Sphingopyxis sp. DHUNG17]|uniref:ribonuclease E/G n=1 Tax=Sphingopyxis jiangsuensis TaxID=2871171 RepID=UPI00191E99F1|nr:ribonuclease E/G [Sphingopyxis lutea]MBL0768133.1 ribonuclease E/G [Sphingopyxis lutea]
MAEWLYEAGIGEARAALVDDGRIVEARIERDDERPRVGAVVAARLSEKAGKGALVTLDLPGAPVATLTAVPAKTSIGAALTVEITRMALRERGRDKPARARIAPEGAEFTDGASLRERIAADGVPVADLGPSDPDRLEEAGWSELIDEVRRGHWPFEGGALWIDSTPAMTVIDIDGAGDTLALARAGAIAAAAAIRCCDIGGSIAIDFPSLAGRAERQEIDALVDAQLPQPFERTAINGFGLMQIIRRRSRPSLVEQVRFDAALADALALLRVAERTAGTGELQLVARPAVADLLSARADWIDMLQRRTGRPVAIRADAAMKGPGHAQ